MYVDSQAGGAMGSGVTALRSKDPESLSRLISSGLRQL